MSKRRLSTGSEEEGVRTQASRCRQTLPGKHYENVNVDGHGLTNVGDNYGTLAFSVHTHHHPESRPQKCQQLLESLTFEYMDARLRNVAAGLPTTCQWVFQNENFRTWSDESRTSEYHGLLWIKGKPASGKSTVMREVITWAERLWPNHIILTYFFNARAQSMLEKSSIGLYRSFVHKLLKAFPGCVGCFSRIFNSKMHSIHGTEDWTTTELQNFLMELFTTKALPPVSMFVDALDEGVYDDVRDTIAFFESLSEAGATKNPFIRLCLSSRHYPQICSSQSLSIVIEEEIGHAEDVSFYVDRYLAKDSDQMADLRRRVCARSGGVFLWVSVVVKMLNGLYLRGKTVSLMNRTLDTLPRDLEDLFADMIARDTEDITQCLTLLHWVLFSLRPLRPTELYLAIQSSSPDEPDARAVSDDGTITRYLSNCSRGLIEYTKTKPPMVQFIHESVRDFLFSGKALKNVSPTPSMDSGCSGNFETKGCHAEMAEQCLRYLMHISDSQSTSVAGIDDNALVEYAAKYWWQHMIIGAEALAPKLVTLAQEFLTSQRYLLTWLRSYNIDSPRKNRQQLETMIDLAPPLYYAAALGLRAVTSNLLDVGSNPSALGGRCGNALQVACFHNNEEVVRLLLDRGADTHQKGGLYGTALQAACDEGSEEIIGLLLNHDSDVNSRGGIYGSPLEAASARGNLKIVEMLLERGAIVNAQGAEGFGNALCAATANGHEDVIRLLLRQEGIDIHAQGGRYGDALQVASRKGSAKIVKLLLEHGADVNAPAGRTGTAVEAASKFRHFTVVRMLVDAGAQEPKPQTNDTGYPWPCNILFESKKKRIADAGDGSGSA